MGLRDFFDGVFYKKPKKPFSMDQVKALITLEVKFKGLNVELEKGDPREASFAIVNYKVVVEEEGEEKVKTVLLGKAYPTKFQRVIEKLVEATIRGDYLKRIDGKIIPAIKKVCNVSANAKK